MKKCKKCITLLLVWCLVMQCTMTNTKRLVHAQQIVKEFTQDNCLIQVEKQAEWDDGYIANVNITNIGTSSINNWKLETNAGQGKIMNVWNGSMKQKGGKVTFYALDYNRILSAGETISLGYEMSDQSFEELSAMVLSENAKSELPAEQYTVTYTITSQWNKGAIVETAIRNCSDKAIIDWELTCQFPGRMKDMWNGSILSNKDDSYRIKNKGYNATIQPGQTVTFGFRAEYPNDTISCPRNEVVTGCGDERQKPECTTTENIAGEGTEQADNTTETVTEINWDDKTDTDGDGLPDVLEQNRYYTDIHNKDTDGDGLEDGYEVEIGTDPAMPDTDEDGVDDREELNQYKTNPLESDTDKDGLIDGDEIVLHLNPLKPDTDGNGILDGEEYISQSVDRENIDSGLFEDNDAVLSYIKLKAKGNINRDADIEEYEGALRHDDPAMIGKPILLEDMEIESGEIEFSLSDEYEIPAYQIDGTCTNGLLICYNDNKEGDTIPLETNYDKKTRTLTAQISKSGIYFIVDVVEMFSGLGIDLEQGTTPTTRKAALRSSSTVVKAGTDTDNVQPETVKGRADIIFAVDTTASMDFYIDNVKYNLSTFVEELSKFNIAASFALVEFKDITVDGEDSTNIKKNGNSVWTSSVNKFKRKIGKLEIEGGGDHLETPIDALETARQIKKHESARKYIILVTDEKYKTDNRYGIKDMDEMIELLCKDDITVSVVSHEQRRNDYKKLYEKTGGKFAAVSQSFAEQLLGIAAGVIKDTNDGYWIALKGLTPEPVKLDEKPTLTGKADKDKDGLLDREELRNLTPTSYISTSSVLGKLTKTGGAGKKLPVYEYYSHPARKDTEHDGINDKEDNRPKVKGIYSAKEKKVVVGEMMIISCVNKVTGHAFLVYKSYVKDTLDFSKFSGGYTYKTWEEEKPCKYKIKPSAYVSIGNAGKGICGSPALSESGSNVNDGDNAGVYFNREFANEHKEGKAMYDLNCAYKKEISTSQIKKIIKVCEDKNYYNFVANNCAEVAIKAWNKAYPKDIFSAHTTPIGLKKEINQKLGSFKFDMSKEVPNIR